MSGSPGSSGWDSRTGDNAPAESPADRAARNIYFRIAMHLGLPVGLSLLVHLLLVVFLALKTFDVLSRPTPELGPWEGSVVEAADLSDAFQWSEERLPTPVDIPAEASIESLTALPAVRAPDLSDLGAAALGRGPGDGAGLSLGEGRLSLLGTGTGGAEAGAGGFGGGLGGGARLGQAGVWSLNIRANKIVYVVDFSGSIIVAVDDLKRELKRSIGRLRPTQSFNVIIFYSSGGGTDERIRTESFRARLEPADEATRRAFFEWIDRQAPMGVTQPLQAIKRALALGPEAIFFFSDGYFDDEIVTEIERANRATQTRIYCLVFDEIQLADTSGLPRRETEGARRLKRVAEANRGQVKIVTGKDLAR